MKKVIIDDVVVPKKDTVVKFGFNQITNPTPEAATKVFRFVLYTTAIINLVLTIFTEIPVEISSMIFNYSIKIVTLVHAISKMFGLEIK